MGASGVTSGLVGIWEGDSEFRVGPQPPAFSFFCFCAVLCPLLCLLWVLSLCLCQEERLKKGGER